MRLQLTAEHLVFSPPPTPERTVKQMAYGNMDLSVGDYRFYRIERGWPTRQKAAKNVVATPQFKSQPIVVQSENSVQPNFVDLTTALQNVAVHFPGLPL